MSLLCQNQTRGTEEKQRNSFVYRIQGKGNEEKGEIHGKKEEEKVENRRKCGSGRNEGIKDKTG
jgi:hypothetical protein